MKMKKMSLLVLSTTLFVFNSFAVVVGALEENEGYGDCSLVGGMDMTTVCALTTTTSLPSIIVQDNGELELGSDQAIALLLSEIYLDQEETPITDYLAQSFKVTSDEIMDIVIDLHKSGEKISVTNIKSNLN